MDQESSVKTVDTYYQLVVSEGCIPDEQGIKLWLESPSV